MELIFDNPKIVLLGVGAVGALDEYFYHYKKANLFKRDDCLSENLLHTARYFIYCLLFFLLATAEVSGIYVIPVIFLLVCDLLVGIGDVIVEPKTRAFQGGLPPGEYLLHMMLSFGLGCFYYGFGKQLFQVASMPTDINFSFNPTDLLSFMLICMSLGSGILFVFGAYHLKESKRGSFIISA